MDCGKNGSGTAENHLSTILSMGNERLGGRWSAKNPKNVVDGLRKIGFSMLISIQKMVVGLRKISRLVVGVQKTST
jgi:hypothetical protein